MRGLMLAVIGVVLVVAGCASGGAAGRPRHDNPHPINLAHPTGAYLHLMHTLPARIDVGGYDDEQLVALGHHACFVATHPNYSPQDGSPNAIGKLIDEGVPRGLPQPPTEPL